MAFHSPSERAGTSTTLCSAGDRVRVAVDMQTLRKLQEGHGGWNNTIGKCIQRVGTMLAINIDGDAVVKFVYDKDKVVEILNMKAVIKSGSFEVGDHVKIIEDRNKVRRLQEAQGLTCFDFLEPLQVGRVTEVSTSGNLLVKFSSFGNKIKYHTYVDPECCIYLQDKEGTADSGGLGSLVFNFLRTQIPLVEAYSLFYSNLVGEAKKGNIDTVQNMLRSDFEPIDTITACQTALMAASSKGHAEIINLLLSYGAKLEILDLDMGQTALHYAIKGIKLHAASILLQKGANVNTKNRRGTTPLHIATERQSAECAMLLLRHNADIHAQENTGNTALHYAASSDMPGITHELIQRGADVNLPNKEGQRPLHMATKSRSLDCVKMLLSNNANINSKDKEDKTALFMALEARNNDIIKVLIDDERTDLSLEYKTRHIPITLAVIHGNAFAVRQIIAKGPHYAKRKSGSYVTPLHLAAFRGHVDVGEVLLSLGNADVHAQDDGGQTPLHLACSRRQTQFVQLLLRNGAVVNVADIDGLTPLHCVLHKEMRSLAKIFLAHWFVEFPLDIMGSRQAEIACMLVIKGADIGRKCHRGQTPLDHLQDNDTLKAKLKQAARLRNSRNPCSHRREDAEYGY